MVLLEQNGGTVAEPPVIPPIITLVVHPIDTAEHPEIPPGWRWAVYAGRVNATSADGCMNAGWEPDQPSALVEGERVAATAVKCARAFGVNVQFGQMVLQYDPIPRGADAVTTFTGGE